MIRKIFPSKDFKHCTFYFLCFYSFIPYPYILILLGFILVFYHFPDLYPPFVLTYFKLLGWPKGWFILPCNMALIALLYVVQSLSCAQLICSPMDCSPPGSISFSRGASQARDHTLVCSIARRVLYH